ncbi:D-sedoheptulose 7-phosphate isomerase [soil metagenome]
MADFEADVLETLRTRYPDLEPCLPALAETAERLTTTFRAGGKLLVCGNGGSASDSEHIVGELMKGFKSPRPLPGERRRQLLERFPTDGAYLADRLQGALPAFSLVSQSALLTAFANDVAPDMVYAQQVYGYGKPGDALLALSTSGDSLNVVRALQVARALGVTTLGLSGRTGGRMKALCDTCICVPEEDTLKVQERHLPLYHALCELLEQAFF